MNLTKSDFTVARTCGTKLFYKKLKYPSLMEDNPYLEFLADGGYMVEAMAKLLYPGGRELGNWSEPDRAFEETKKLIETEDCTLFEATAVYNGLQARVDILVRQGDVLQLVEVKSSSFDSHNDGPNPFRGKKGGIPSEWRPYLEDVTFQVMVLRRAFPQFTVVPSLCIVDKAKSATANATFDKFRFREQHGDDRQWKPQVDYVGNRDELQSAHVLAVIDVSSEVNELTCVVEAAAEQFSKTLQADPILRITPEIGQKCKSCEYRIPLEKEGRNGFQDCWGSLALSDPHALDLYRVDLLGGKNRDVVAEMAASGRSSLSDVPKELLSGTTARRQTVQLECTASGTEKIDSDLKRILLNHHYPLHFMDFEGSRLAVPFHAGMRPYEQASFQWSCHTIPTSTTPIQHTEWLNTDDSFPNFEFARTLKDQIGSVGTVYIWSHYEIDILREIRRQMDKYGESDGDLAAWIEELTTNGNPRLVDLCALAKDYYFHPSMKGSLSIKNVLPAVWEGDANVRRASLFTKYVQQDKDGNYLSPYSVLPPLPIGEKEEVVKEGTGAMRVYQEMMFGRAKDDDTIRQIYRKLLLQYCELDTAAMVAIWMHWTQVYIQ